MTRLPVFFATICAVASVVSQTNGAFARVRPRSSRTVSSPARSSALVTGRLTTAKVIERPSGLKLWNCRTSSLAPLLTNIRRSVGRASSIESTFFAASGAFASITLHMSSLSNTASLVASIAATSASTPPIVAEPLRHEDTE